MIPLRDWREDREHGRRWYGRPWFDAAAVRHRLGQTKHRADMNQIDERIQAAFAAVPREKFLPRKQRRHAGENRPLLIGHEQTNSQPTTVRQMLQMLDPRTGHRVLDVGSGSGWTSALLGHLVGPTGVVYGVELIPELADMARRNLTAAAQHWVSVHQAEIGVLGAPSQAPFDRILVSAEATSLPAALVDQLDRRARMVIPVSGRLSVVERDEAGSVAVRRVGHYSFVPLK